MDTPHNPLERSYRNQHPIRTLLYFYQGHVKNLLLALFFYCIKHSGVWALPLFTAAIIDVVTQKRSADEIWVYGALLLVIYVQNVPTHTIYVHFLSTANRSMETKLRSALAWRLQHLSMHFYHRNSTGALQTKLVRDVELIEQLTRQLFELVPVTVVTMLIALAVTAVRAPGFLIFFVLVIPLTLVLIRVLKKPIDERNSEFHGEIAGMSSRLLEMVHLIPVTRAHGIEQDELRKVDAHLERVREVGVRLDRINATFGASAWVVFQLANAACLVFAANFALSGQLSMSIGDIVLMTSYFSTLTNSVSTLLSLMPQIAKGFVSVKSVAEVLESPDLEHNAGKPPVNTMVGGFTLENVGFAYPDTEEASLKQLSLDVQPGETIAVIGQSGSGKSTLLNLLIGFIRPTSGRILLDGIDMNTLDLRTYRRFLSFVPQSTVLFEGSVRDNILYGTQEVTEERLWQAICDANADDFILDLPQGIDTVIGENGARLSGGQRQRIAIARALIRDPRILILDEATSALDSQTEALIQQALERLMQGRTTFVVAHRLSTIRYADRIVVLEKGRIVEVGNHTDLMAKGGAYAQYHQVREELS